MAHPPPTYSATSEQVPSFDDADVGTYVALLKALSHPVRFRIVDLIRQNGGELCVCELEKHFKLTQPTISHHLKVLRDAGLVRSRRDGTWVHHSIEPRAFDHVRQLMDLYAKLEETAASRI